MNILFGRRRSEKVCDKEPEVRITFAQEVVDLEAEINFNCTIEKVQKLTDLYTEAIEFYESLRNPKHFYYQERLQWLLSRPQVLSLLNSKRPLPTLNRSLSDSSSFVIKPADFSPKSLTNTTKLPLERNCEKVLQNHNIESTSLSRKIFESFKAQSESLLSRLEHRKKTRSDKRFFLKKQEMSQCDKSGGEARPSPVEEFEAEVERIMEVFVEEKTSVRKDIEEKYREYLLEIEGVDCDVMKSLKKELYKNMNTEISEKIKVLEAKRAQAIATARKNLVKNC